MSHSAPARRLRGPAVVTAALLITLRAGCGGSDEAGDVAATTGAPPVAESEPADGDDCAAAQPEINAGVQVTGFVTSVEVPSCDKATIATSLGATPDDVQSALGICSIAANEASGHGVAAVSIVSADGTELATGTNAGDCAGTS